MLEKLKDVSGKSTTRRIIFINLMEAKKFFLYLAVTFGCPKVNFGLITYAWGKRKIIEPNETMSLTIINQPHRTNLFKLLSSSYKKIHPEGKMRAKLNLPANHQVKEWYLSECYFCSNIIWTLGYKFVNLGYIMRMLPP